MMKHFLLALTLACALAASMSPAAHAQQAASGAVQANSSASAGPMRATTVTSLLDRVFGSTAGFVIYRGASNWAAAAPGSTSAVQAWDADLDALAAFSSTGFAARTASNTWAQRSIAVPTGLSITNPAGVAGNPTIGWDIASLTADGSPTGGSTFVPCETSGTMKKCDVADLGAGGAGGMTSGERQNFLLSLIYQSKAFAGYRRVINLFADGYKASDGVNSGSSSNYSVDTSSGRVAPTTGSDEVPTMTGASTPSGTVAATSSFGAGFEAYRAFDDVTAGSNCWFSNGVPSGGSPQEISYDWGSAKAIISYTVRASTSACIASETARAPNTWTMDGWTGSAWVQLDSQSGITWTSGQQKTFTVTSPGSYNKYRLNITANNGGANGVGIAEIEFMQASNMILITTSQTPDSTVNLARVLLEYNPVIALTLNTDLTVEVTCNGGTNWASATLSSVGTGQAGRSVAETSDTSCTSGVSAAARIKNLNKKNVQVYGATLTVH